MIDDGQNSDIACIFLSVRLIFLAAVLALLGGCGTAATHTSLGPPYTPAERASADDLMPLPRPDRGTAVVRVTDHKGEQHDQPDTIDPIGPGRWRMQVAGFWIVDVKREPDGTVSILREVELDEARRVEYDPPLPLLPASLTFDNPIEHITEARVYDHDNGTLQSQGTCTAVYRLLGSKIISLPGAEVNAIILQTDRRFDLPWVQVDLHILAAYVPGEGVVAWQTRRDIRLLGLLPISREQRVVRVR
jgi:hypothetical protein